MDDQRSLPPLPSTRAVDPTLDVPATAPPPLPTRARSTHGDQESALPQSDGTLMTGGATGRTTLPASSATLVVPGHELLGELGRGGMGVVYRARQVKANRVVALKMIRSSQHASLQDKVRFQIEAEAVARLQHPNIVQVFEVGEHDGLPFFSLEFCEGGALDRLLKDKPLSAAEAVTLLEKLAKAMHVAHQHGIVHRDLKPANVLLTTDGEPKITDFGLAKQLDRGSNVSQSGAVMGTPAYMAPEQASGHSHEVGPAADVYALGAILYEVLTGRPPFRGSSVMDTLDQVRTREPEPPSRLRPKTPLDLETICLKCLRKEPGERYASAEALAEEFRRFRVGEPILARPAGRGERVVKWARRRPALAALLIVTVVAAISLVALAVNLALARQAADENARNANDQTGIALKNETEANTQKGKAQEAQKATEAALKRESEAKEDAINKREEATRSAQSLAYTTLRFADSAWELGQVLGAREILERVPPELRDWQWAYLRRKLQGSYATLYGNLAPVLGVAISPEGARIASAGGDGTVRLWDLRRSEQQPVSLRGHTAKATSVAFSPDGSRLASTSDDMSVRVWDTRRLDLPPLTLPVRAITASVAFSPDGRHLAAGCGDSTVRVWDLFRPDSDPLLLNVDRIGVAKSIAFGPDGHRLAAGCEMANRGVVKVWDLRRPLEPPVELRTQTLFVLSVAFSPDGRRVAAGETADRISVWDLEEKTPLLLSGHAGAVHSVAFSPDGQRLVSGGRDETVRVWNLLRPEQPPLILRGHVGAVNSVAFNTDGQSVVSGGADRTVKLWDTRQSEQQPLALRGQEEMIEKPNPLAMQPTRPFVVAFSADGNQAAVSEPILHHLTYSRHSHIKVWDLRSPDRKPVTLPGHTQQLFDMAFSPDGQTLVSAGADRIVELNPMGSPPPPKLSIKLWNLRAPGQPPRELLHKHKSFITGIAFSPDGQRLATGSYDGVIKLWAVHRLDAPPLVLRGVPHSATKLAFSPQGQHLAAGCQDMVVRVWDLSRPDAEPLRLPGHTHTVTRVAFSPDGDRLASASEDTTIKVWDLRRPEQRPLTLWGHTGYVQDLAFSPDGRELASGSSDQAVKVWDLVRPEQQPLTIRGHLKAISRVGFSADGRRLTSASDDRTVKVWLLRATDPLPQTLRSHEATVYTVAFSPDGRRLASGSLDLTVKVWDVQRPAQPTSTLRGHARLVDAVAFSPDGQKVYSRDAAGETLTWNTATGDPLVSDHKLTGALDNGAASPDGRRLALPQTDGGIELVELSLLSADGLAYRRARGALDPFWHHQESERQRLSNQWFAVAFHRSQIVRSDPTDANTWGALDDASREARDWQPTRILCDRLLRDDPACVPAAVRRATMNLEEGKYLAALDDAFRALGDDFSSWPKHSEWAAFQGHQAAYESKWPVTLSLFARAALYNRSDAYQLHSLAFAQLASGDEVSFRHLCRQLQACVENPHRSVQLPIVAVGLSSVFDSGTPFGRAAGVLAAETLHRREMAYRAHWLARTAVLLPSSDIPAAELVRCARFGADERIVGVYGETTETLGAALYRAGQYKEAVAVLNEAVKQQPRGVSYWTAHFLAMAYHHLGDAGKAKEWLDKTANPPRKNAFWAGQVTYQHLHAEAEALLAKK